MAKTATPASIVPPQVEAGAGDSRSVMLSVKLSDGSETQMSRTDYIKNRFAAGADRSTIRKEVSALQGKDVPYQTIYQATKEKKSEGAASGEAATAESGEGAVA